MLVNTKRQILQKNNHIKDIKKTGRIKFNKNEIFF